MPRRHGQPLKLDRKQTSEKIVVTGVPVAPGMAVGHAVYHQNDVDVPILDIGPDDVKAELARLTGALRTTKRQLAVLEKSIAEMDLSVRSSNCLEAERIFTLGDLVSRTETDLMQVRNFGKTSLMEIKGKLIDLGLSLAESTSQPT